MATCGPSNPAQGLKDFVQRDGTLHAGIIRPEAPPVTRGLRSNQARAPHQQQQQYLHQFMVQPSEFQIDEQAFLNSQNSLVAGPEQHFAHHLPNRTQNGTAAGYFNPARAQPVEGQEWAAQFQNLSLHDRFEQQPGVQPYSYQPAFVPPQFAPRFAHNLAPTVVAKNRQLDPMIASDEAFNSAFAEAELNFQRMQNQSQQQQQQQQTAKSLDQASSTTSIPETGLSELKQGEDASAVAHKIINSLHEKTPGQPELSAKLQNSKFMNLMVKLSTNEVKLGDNELVNAESNAQVDPFELHQSVPPAPETVPETAPESNGTSTSTREVPNHDWAPQRPITVSQATGDTKPSLSFSQNHGLDDPETYLLKMKKNLDPRVFKRSQYTSAFGAGKEHGISTLQTGNWEETYEEW